MGSCNSHECRRERDDQSREIANMAEEIAFWAYQAKHYCAVARFGRSYDDCSRTTQRAVDELLEQNRIAENRERYGHAEPARDIGS